VQAPCTGYIFEINAKIHFHTHQGLFQETSSAPAPTLLYSKAKFLNSTKV
jgi:hypothetical protein